MLNFEEELKKFKPGLEAEEVDKVVSEREKEVNVETEQETK